MIIEFAPNQKVDILKEYVAGGPNVSVWQNLRKSLPKYVDDITQDFGTEVYQKMLRDPVINACIDSIKLQVLSNQIRFEPNAAAPGRGEDPSPEFVKASQIADFVASNIDQLEDSIYLVLEEMLDSIAQGNSVAEQNYELKDGSILLGSLRVKDRSNYAFVVDEFNRHIGFLYREPGSANQIHSRQLSSDEALKILPREKFFALSYSRRGGDPRGTSILRPAYNAWYLKQAIWPEYLKYISQFANPSLIGKVAENAKAEKNDAGEMLPATEALVSALENLFQGGTVVGLPHGTEVDPIEVQGDGEAFVTGIDMLNREMVLAILGNVRATLESKHGSRADSETAKDILDNSVLAIVRWLELEIRSQIVRPLVVYNFGQLEADQFCPIVNIASTPNEDLPKVWDSLSRLFASGYIHSSQLPELDSKYGLPERDLEAIQAEELARRDLQRMEGLERLRLRNPEDEG